MALPLRFLVADCEAEKDRKIRRDDVGRSSGESFCATLRSLAPHAACDRKTPSDPDAAELRAEDLAAYDAVFLSGASLHVYDDTPETRRLLAFMRTVFASKTPAFGSCAGLQIAAAAAGGSVRPNRNGAEAPIAHQVKLTPEGRNHPLFAGRPPAFEALSIHSDEVDRLPEGALRLAGNGVTAVQAAEIRSSGGVFWGVQYHPELPAAEMASSLRRQASELAEQGAASSPVVLERRADEIASLDDADDGTAFPAELKDRQLELRNFIAHLVEPTRAARGRT